MPTYIALLRGINVGGKNLLPMKHLVEIFAANGCNDVCTFIQSGNVVFSADAAQAKALPQRISKRISDKHGLQVPVVLRSASELRKVIKSHPGLKTHDADALHVMFLADKPKAAGLAALDPSRSPPDTFTALGREIYLCLPNGVARSKLTNAYFDSKLATVSTLRNWRTVLKLAELADELLA